MKRLCWLVALIAGTVSAAVPFKNGTRFALKDVPGELVVERRAGEPVRFALEENGTTGYQWAAEWNTNECEVIKPVALRERIKETIHKAKEKYEI